MMKVEQSHKSKPEVCQLSIAAPSACTQKRKPLPEEKLIEFPLSACTK